ncbi:MAG: hypothetical protein VB135_04135, partial [Burkholderia sp.]
SSTSQTSSLDDTFYPKSVSRKTGAAAKIAMGIFGVIDSLVRALEGRRYGKTSSSQCDRLGVK